MFLFSRCYMFDHGQKLSSCILYILNVQKKSIDTFLIEHLEEKRISTLYTYIYIRTNKYKRNFSDVFFEQNSCSHAVSGTDISFNAPPGKIESRNKNVNLRKKKDEKTEFRYLFLFF